MAAGLGSLPVSLLAHGTTVATNALLERRGAEVALVTNAGMEDVIEIARQDRPSLYDQWADRPPPLVERGRRYGVPGRLAADGSELEAVVPEGLPAIEAEAVAVCLLHSDLDDRHEVAVAAHLRALGHDVTCSHEVSPELREYERTVTTVVNAYLRPACRSYLQGLAGLAPAVSVMTSAGGLVDLAFAADRPAALLLSGPAAGVRAAAAIAVANGFHGAVGLRHGRHVHRRLPDRGRSPRSVAVPGGRRLPGAPAGAWRSTPWGPAAARWRGSTQGAPCRSARGRPERCPARRATGEGAVSRR